MQEMTVTNVAVVTTKFLFGMCDCTIHSDVGTGDFSLMLEILHVSGHAHVSPGMDWSCYNSPFFPCYYQSRKN